MLGIVERTKSIAKTVGPAAALAIRSTVRSASNRDMFCSSAAACRGVPERSDETLDFTTGLQEITYTSPGILVRKDPFREMQRNQRLVLSIEIRKRIGTFASLPQAAIILIYRFVITDGTVLEQNAVDMRSVPGKVRAFHDPTGSILPAST